MPDTIQFDHVALGLRRIDDGLPLVRDQLKARHLAGMSDGPYLWSQWRFMGGGVIELMEPDGPPGGFLHRFLAERGPGFHHVTFKVPSLVETTARARDLGYEIVGYNDSHPQWKEAFLHPKQAHGIVVQMAESQEHHELPEPPDDAAQVLGLRMSAQQIEPIRRQWSELLGAEESQDDAVHRFRWKGSPMEIQVELDPRASEGPLHVELRCPRPLDLPAGPYPELGATFVQTELGDAG